MKADKIFSQKLEKSTDFKFDNAVVHVFDDMVVRSVPYYLEIQRMMTEIIKDYASSGTALYDLGCATGTTLLSINTVLDDSVSFVGVDDSPQMLESCGKNLTEMGVSRPFKLLEADLNQGLTIDNASVVVLCLTLQFIRPINRLNLLKQIHEQLLAGGCIILVEKVLGESTEFNRQFIKYYYDMKRRNDYADMEIAQKREALENVLIPYKSSENIQLLLDAGFHSCETFFKWHNFAGFVALK
jgi:tRNA (cmo5U34)-methyltransferase